MQSFFLKAKPIPIMPGTGMAIEVCVSGVDKVDDCHDSWLVSSFIFKNLKNWI